MELNLSNSIVFFDLETTGINVSKDRIVEIALLKISPSGKEDEKIYRVNPEMPIPKASSEVHGIYDKDVENEPTFKMIAKDVAKFMEGADIAGYNSNRFDVPLLAEEFLRVGLDFDMKKRKFVDVQNIFHKMEKRTLGAAYKFYCQKELINAHSAAADTRATFEILKAQIGKYEEELQNDVAFLSNFSKQNDNADFAGFIVYDEKGVEVFNFGKNKGVAVYKVLEEQPGYYGWIMGNDFPLYTKKVLTEIKMRGSLLIK